MEFKLRKSFRLSGIIVLTRCLIQHVATLVSQDSAMICLLMVAPNFESIVLLAEDTHRTCERSRLSSWSNEVKEELNAVRYGREAIMR